MKHAILFTAALLGAMAALLLGGYVIFRAAVILFVP